MVWIRKLNFFEALLFLFFITLHADQLSMTVGGFTFRLNNLIAAFLLLTTLLAVRHCILAFEKKVLLGFAILAFTLLLTTFSSPYVPRTLIFFGWFGVTALLYLFLPALLVNVLGRAKVLRLYLLSFFCVGGFAFLQFFLSLIGVSFFAPQTLFGSIVRPNALAYEPSYYALYMTPFVVMVNAIYLMRPEKIKLSFVFLANALFILSTSTSCFFAYLLFIIFFLFFRERKKIIKFTLGLACAMGGLCLFLPLFFKDYLLKFFFYGLSHHSFSERWLGITNVWKIFISHPLLGVGLGGVPPTLFNAWATRDPDTRFLCTSEQVASSSNPMKYFEPMNVFTELLASVGLIGTLLTFFLLSLFFLRAKNSLKGNMRTVGALFLLSTLVMLGVLQFNQGLLRTYVWVHLALGYSMLAPKRDLQLS